jgi:hypothetical protein
MMVITSARLRPSSRTIWHTRTPLIGQVLDHRDHVGALGPRHGRELGRFPPRLRFRRIGPPVFVRQRPPRPVAELRRVVRPGLPCVLWAQANFLPVERFSVRALLSLCERCSDRSDLLRPQSERVT